MAKHIQIIKNQKTEEEQKFEDQLNKRLTALGMSGLITFVADHGMKGYELRKIKYANRQMAFAIPARLAFEKNSICRFLIEAKKDKFLRAGYSYEWVFPNRDEQMQDFLQWFVFDEEDEVPYIEFLENLFQRRRME